MDAKFKVEVPNKNSIHSNNTSENTFEDIPNCFSSDDEIQLEIKVDPFKHRLKMTKLDWCRTYLLAVLIIPIRVVLVSLTLLLGWLVSSIALFNLSEEDKSEKPIAPRWRKLAQGASSFLGRTSLRFCGFSVTVKGKMASAEEAPILVAAPHSSFFDAFVLFWSRTPYLVSREENKKLPVLGKCIELSQSINVKREDPNSRQNTVKEIIRRTNLHNHPDPKERWPQLLIFPEGSCSNRKALVSFKSGAFHPGKPVQPILVRYPNMIDTITWTWNQPHGAKSVMWTTLAQPFTRAEIEFLPVYYPNSFEIKDAKLFAANVRHLMAEALQVPTSEMTFEEVKSRYARHYKNKKSIKIKDKEA